MNKRNFIGGAATALGLALAASAWPPPAVAQALYPNKPVRMVVPFPAGTSPDIVARYLSQKLGERMGQTFIVDNRAGAAGLLACWPPNMWPSRRPTGTRCSSL